MKYCGHIGFATTKETSPGIWEEFIEEKFYTGDVVSNRKNNADQKVNGTMSMNNRISIVCDPFLYKNFASIRYAEFNGVKWTVSGVEIERPRLLLSFGEQYVSE